MGVCVIIFVLQISDHIVRWISDWFYCSSIEYVVSRDYQTYRTCERGFGRSSEMLRRRGHHDQVARMYVDFNGYRNCSRLIVMKGYVC